MHRHQHSNTLVLLSNNALITHYENKVSHTRRWRALALTISLSIAIWMRDPGFDFIPAIAALIFKVIGFFAYGVFGPADSFISSAWRYFNLGYATVFGPFIILTLTWNWLKKEKQLTDITNTIIKQRLTDQGHAYTYKQYEQPHHFIIALILVISVTIAFLQLFEIKAKATDITKVPGYSACGYDGKQWIEPWPKTETWLIWLRFHKKNWCIDGVKEDLKKFKLPGFRSASADKYFEKKPAIIKEINNNLILQKYISNDDLNTITSIFTDQDPFERFPYIYPPLNFTFSVLCWITTIILCARYIFATRQIRLTYRFIRTRTRKLILRRHHRPKSNEP